MTLNARYNLKVRFTDCALDVGYVCSTMLWISELAIRDWMNMDLSC